MVVDDGGCDVGGMASVRRWNELTCRVGRLVTSGQAGGMGRLRYTRIRQFFRTRGEGRIAAYPWPSRPLRGRQ